MLAIFIASFALLVSLLGFGDRLAVQTTTNEYSDDRDIELAESRRKLARCIYKFGFRILLTIPIWTLLFWQYALSADDFAAFLQGLAPAMQSLAMLALLVPVWFAFRFALHLRGVSLALRGKNETSFIEFYMSRSRRSSN